MCRWYAGQQYNLVDNVPAIEKRWIEEADRSLVHGAAPLNLEPQNGESILYKRRVKVQRRQIERRMRENLAAQSKIVLDLLPKR